MRPVALGRKNWIHIGTPLAGRKVAATLSVVESCCRLQVPVRDYFSAILPGLSDLPIRCLPDLTPAVWVTRHSWNSSDLGISVKSFCDQKHSFLFADKPPANCRID